ncbi:hypothetical protein QBC41DRAFT_336507 [Cercophora samala]|uniref:Extracellular membrane protein CFEM domain-containing protein n=1 Tax=Cercophora samala TaxID=330535 RepID=A0AA39ZF25_9PEZI|nr:hypothetical protein QBC41DRAFT_336507 [Cercophora samala]
MFAKLRPLGVINLLLGFAHLAACAAPSAFTITDEPDYSILRTCGKDCLWSDINYWVGGTLQCGSPYVNDCLCRVEFAPLISSHASSCIETLCTVGPVDGEISSFLSLYNTYQA